MLAPRPASAEPQVSDVDRQLAALTERLETVVEQHNAVRADLAATQARINATTARVTEITQALDSARQRVGRIATWAYQNGPTAGVGAVLTAGSARDVISRLAAMDNVARTDRRQIRTLADGAATLEADNAALRRLLGDQNNQEAELSGLTVQVEKDLAALKVLREQIGSTSRGTSTTSDSANPPAPAPAVSGAAGVAVSFAYAQIGKPYQWAAAGPRAYDCSGLTSAAWQAAGVSLPHNAARQYSAMAHVSRGDLRPGDLVFYYSDIHHVAIFVGDESVIHAPTAGQSVRLERLNHAPIKGFGRPS